MESLLSTAFDTAKLSEDSDAAVTDTGIPVLEVSGCAEVSVLQDETRNKKQLQLNALQH